MELTRELFSDILDVGPLVIGKLRKNYEHVQMEKDSVEELSDRLNRKVSNIIVPDISTVGMHFDFTFSPDDTVESNSPHILREIQIYRNKRIALNSGQPVPVLVVGKRELDRSIRTYGIIVPDKLTHNNQNWPYAGTFHGLRKLFRADSGIAPIFTLKEIEDNLERRLEGGDLWAGTTLSFLLHAVEADGNIISIKIPFEFPFYLRYERGVYIAYESMRNNLGNMTTGNKIVLRYASSQAEERHLRDEMPILLRPLQLPKGRVARSQGGIMRYVTNPNSELHLQYAPLSTTGMGLYSSGDLFQRAIDFSTKRTYSLTRYSAEPTPK